MDASRLRKSARHESEQLAPSAPDLDRDDREDRQDALGNSGVQRLAAAGAQAKLEVGAADDRFEQEADQVADEVMGGPVAQSARDAGGATPDVQRAGGGAGFAASDALGEQLGAASGGHGVPAAMRETMERKTGASLGDVRVHDDAAAHQMTAGVGAHAFTHGKDIHFAQGAYDPGSRAGQHLLAHELTHVVQQSGGQAAGVQRKAISAAPASVQRLWNPFAKTKPVSSPDPVTIPDLTTVLATPALKRHWADWNFKHRNDGKGDEGIGYKGWWDELQAHIGALHLHAREAIDSVDHTAGDTTSQDDGLSVIAKTRMDSGFRDKADDEHAISSAKEEKARKEHDSREDLNLLRLKRDLLDPLKSIWAKSRNPSPVFLRHAQAYAQRWDQGRLIVDLFAKHIGTGDINLSPEEKREFQANYQRGDLHKHLIPKEILNPEFAESQQWRDAYSQYAADPEVQDFYRSRG